MKNKTLENNIDNLKNNIMAIEDINSDSPSVSDQSFCPTNRLKISFDDKIYLLKNHNGSYIFWDPFEGWQNTWGWKFAYFFFSLEDAKQIKQFLCYHSSDSYRVVSRVL